MTTVYVTAPTAVASELATSLVEEELAACVNRFGCQSTFRWDGDVVEEEEVVLLAKTTDERYEDLKRHVLENHPYDVPCVERFEEDDILDSFAGWIEDSVR